MEEETKKVNHEERKGYNIVALIFGIISILTSCLVPVIPFATAIVSIIFGVLGIKKDGKGMGIAGLICSIVAMIMQLVYLFFIYGVSIL